MTEIVKEGRRYYLRGLPFAGKDAAKAAGCKWDPDARAWWSSKQDVAEGVVASLGAAAQPASAGEAQPEAGATPQREAPGQDATVAGRVRYKGKTYYAAGRVLRGRSVYDDSVEPVQTRDRAKTLLYFRDGSSSFWAPSSMIEVDRWYDRPQTIGRLARYAEKAKAAKAQYGYVPIKGEDYCGYPCPVDGHICTPDSPCHDCAP